MVPTILPLLVFWKLSFESLMLIYQSGWTHKFGSSTEAPIKSADTKNAYNRSYACACACLYQKYHLACNEEMVVYFTLGRYFTSKNLY